MRLLLFFVFFALGLISLTSQRAISDATNTQPVQAQQTISIMPSNFSGKPEVKYLEDRDETLVQVFIPLSEKSISKDQSEKLGMYARFGVPGKKITEPKNITIEFRSESPKPQFKDSDKRHVTILLNGQRYTSSTLALIYTRTNPLGTYSESMMNAFAYGTFLRVSMAREITIFLGSKTFDLTADQIRALDALMKTIEP
jgi:hypothetical protein